MSPPGTFLYESLVNLYQPNMHANAVKYNDFLSSLRLWLPKFASIKVRFCTFASFRNMSLTASPPCIGLISVLLSYAGLRCRHTVQFGLGIMMKLLHLSAVLSTPNGAIICCPCNLSNSFLISSCTAYVTHQHGTWFCFMPSLTFKTLCLWSTQLLWTHHCI